MRSTGDWAQRRGKLRTVRGTAGALVGEVAIVAGGLASDITSARITIRCIETYTMRSRMLRCNIAPDLGTAFVSGRRTVDSSISR